MTVVAVGTAAAVLSIVGLVLGAVVLGVVVALFNRVLRPAQEIEAYASDILDAGVGIAKGVDGVDDLGRTLELGGAVPGLATAYLEKLGAGR